MAAVLIGHSSDDWKKVVKWLCNAVWQVVGGEWFRRMRRGFGRIVASPTPIEPDSSLREVRQSNSRIPPTPPGLAQKEVDTIVARWGEIM